MNQETYHTIPAGSIVNSDFRPQIEQEDDDNFIAVDIHSADFRPKIVLEEEEVPVPKDVIVLESVELVELPPPHEEAKTEPEETPPVVPPNVLSLAERAKLQSTAKAESETS